MPYYATRDGRKHSRPPGRTEAFSPPLPSTLGGGGRTEVSPPLDPAQEQTWCFYGLKHSALRGRTEVFPPRPVHKSSHGTVHCPGPHPGSSPPKHAILRYYERPTSGTDGSTPPPGPALPDGRKQHSPPRDPVLSVITATQDLLELTSGLSKPVNSLHPIMGACINRRLRACVK